MAVTSTKPGIENAPWREHYPENVPTHLGYPARAAWCLLKRAAEESPDRVACWHMDESWTYAELWNRAQAAATRFTALGVRPGHRVALMLPNMPIAMNSLINCPKAMIPWWENAALNYRGVNGNAWPLPGPSLKMHPFLSWMKPPAPWIRSQKNTYKMPCTI